MKLIQNLLLAFLALVWFLAVVAGGATPLWLIKATVIAAAAALIWLVWYWTREEKAQGVKSWRPDAFT